MNYQRRAYDLADGQISAVHFGRTANPLKLVFLHANGFNALSYHVILHELGVHAVALDLRGHGMSALPLGSKNPRNWSVFTHDVVQFIHRHTKGKIVLSGHSLGAAISVLAAAELPERTSGVCAFDAVTLPPFMQIFPYLPGGLTFIKNRFPMARRAGKRRAQFDSLEAAFARYRRRGTFKNISDATLLDYLQGGLIATENGVKLACDPLWEQAIYAAQGNNIYRAAAKLPAASTLIYFGINGASTSTTRAKMHRIIGANRYEFHKNAAHFHPLEHPGFAVDALNKALKTAALAR